MVSKFKKVMVALVSRTGRQTQLHCTDGCRRRQVVRENNGLGSSGVINLAVRFAVPSLLPLLPIKFHDNNNNTATVPVSLPTHLWVYVAAILLCLVLLALISRIRSLRSRECLEKVCIALAALALVVIIASLVPTQFGWIGYVVWGFGFLMVFLTDPTLTCYRSLAQNCIHVYGWLNAKLRQHSIPNRLPV